MTTSANWAVCLWVKHAPWIDSYNASTLSRMQWSWQHCLRNLGTLIQGSWNCKWWALDLAGQNPFPHPIIEAGMSAHKGQWSLGPLTISNHKNKWNKCMVDKNSINWCTAMVLDCQHWLIRPQGKDLKHIQLAKKLLNLNQSNILVKICQKD